MKFFQRTPMRSSPPVREIIASREIETTDSNRNDLIFLMSNNGESRHGSGLYSTGSYWKKNDSSAEHSLERIEALGARNLGPGRQIRTFRTAANQRVERSPDESFPLPASVSHESLSAVPDDQVPCKTQTQEPRGIGSVFRGLNPTASG